MYYFPMMPLTLLNKYILRLGAIALLSIFTLTGCPNNSEQSNTPQTTPTNTTQPTTESPQETASQSPSESTPPNTTQSTTESPQETASQSPSESTPPNKNPQTTGKYHVYIIFAPIPEEPVKTAYKFLQSAKVKKGETSLFIEGNTYTIALLCREDGIATFHTNDQVVNKDTDIDSLVKKVKEDLIDINKNKKSCQSQPNSLVKITTNFQDAAESKNQKIIAFLQVPWTQEQFEQFSQSSSGKKSLDELMKPTVEHIAKTGQFEQLILFGLDPNYAEQIGIHFQALNSITQKSTNSDQDQEYLKAVHQKLSPNQ